MKLSNRTKARITLAVLFFAFDAAIFIIKDFNPLLRIDPFTWVLFVFAASFGGAGIAYLAIGDWIRWPFTKEVPHTSNPNMTEIEPKYEGWLNSLGVLLCCPICSATWVAAALLGLLALDYNLGYYLILVLSVGGAARLVLRLTELLEWQSRYAQERTADLNFRNTRRPPEHADEPYYQVINGKIYRVVRDEEIKSPPE